MLVLGRGVGVGPRSFRRHYPPAEMDLVEIDPGVVELAGRHFGFAPVDTLAFELAQGAEAEP